jgi:hypothetical protein
VRAECCTTSNEEAEWFNELSRQQLMSGPGHVLQVSGTLTTYELTDARCGTVDSSAAFDTGVVYPG